MIKIESIPINELEDYKNILLQTPEVFRNNPYTQKWIEALKLRVGLKCTSLLLEYPYYDSEYLSSYYQYYIKKFRDYGKASCRIHFICKNEYLGYMTLSPTVHYINFSKSYLSPKLFLETKAFLMLSQFEANLFGVNVGVHAFPWMNQQRDFCTCAHVAAWSIMKFYGNEHSGYGDVTIGALVESVPENLSRKLPSKGLTLQQMADIFRKFGITPLILKKEESNQNEFIREMFCYIESGIPIVAAIDKKNHAVAVIGHGDIDYSKLDKCSGLIDSSCCVKSLIVNDDNLFPYMEIKHANEIDGSLADYSIEDFDFILIPIYNRVHQEYRILYERVKQYLKTKNLVYESDSVLRIYLASAKSLKQHTVMDDSMNGYLKKIIVGLEMPKLVWCAEISSYDEYREKKISAKMIIDSTASPGDTTPWILVHDREKIKYYSNGKWYETKCEISAYSMYQHNLKGV